MFRNYLSAALRNLARNRLYAAISIVGLSIGFAAAIFIGLFIREELSYEKFIPGYENVYKVSYTFQTPGTSPQKSELTFYALADWLKHDFPELEVGRQGGDWRSVRHGEFESHESVAYADQGFLSVFPFPVVAGDLRTALATPDSVVLTRSMAQKFFGEDAPIGKTLEINRQHTLRVTAVLEDLPSSTHLSFRILAAAATPPAGLWPGPHIPQPAFMPTYTYFRLGPGSDLKQIERQLASYVKEHLKPPPGQHISLEAEPIAKLHLRAGGINPQKPPGDAKVLVALGIVGVLILAIAGFNFVTLMTARSAQRAVEVGVRKLVGAGRRDLMVQFVGEATIYVALGMLLAMAIVEISLPAFNTLLDRSLGKFTAPAIAFDYWRDPSLVAALAAVVLIMGTAAGFYPALVMSAFRPATVLKGASIRGGGSLSVRQVLVVAQFAVLVILIFCALVIHRQTSFALNEALRIDRDQVVLIFFGDPKVRHTFQQALVDVPGVEAVTSSQSAPTNFSFLPFVAATPDGNETTLYISAVDFGFHEFYGLPLLAGRHLSRDRSTDTARAENDDFISHPVSVLVNESTSRLLGYASPEAAVGQMIKVGGLPPAATITIVGVVPDFPVDSVRMPIRPTVYFVHPNMLIMISARLNGQQIPETLARIDALWKRIGEPRAIPRQFLDEYYDYIYTDIRQQGKLFTVACILAVSIACLGLFGLSVFSAQRRTKEIGIRKAMGAASGDVLRLLLWSFAKPVLLANLIAWPVALLAMDHWLDGFAYRVDLEWWLLPAASFVALAIAMLTVSAHCYKVSRSKPVHALRYE
jgi:putative ABC transport system permease protein